MDSGKRNKYYNKEGNMPEIKIILKIILFWIQNMIHNNVLQQLKHKFVSKFSGSPSPQEYPGGTHVRYT
jgi:hypothetical protein